MVETYTKLDSITHIHKRPDMYIGSIKTKKEESEIIYDKEMKSVENISVNSGFIRIFLEALSNAIDNFYRSNDTKMTKIMIELDSETGLTSIYNDGNYIPIRIHEKENIYVPELIFGHLLSSSNYDDSQNRQTSGRNGLGIKLLNVFSSEFEIECNDPELQLNYKQKWRNHMKECEKPKIKKKKLDKGSIKVSWIPDFSLFGLTKYTKNHILLYKKYVVDAAMITKIPVYWNKEKIYLKNFLSYVKLYFPKDKEIKYIDGIIEGDDKNQFKIEYVISESFLPFSILSFVNGIKTNDGGVHCDKFTSELYKILCKKLSKFQIIPKEIKQYFNIFLNVSVINPEFSSQSKTKMISCANTINCNFPAKVYNNIMKWNFIKEIENLKKAKELINLKKSEKKRGFKKIDGLDQANFAGTKKSKDCTLILTEGLSAKTYATLGITKGFEGKQGRNYFGIYPLRGKLLNVRNCNLQSISNNKEISDIIQSMNLKFNTDYTDEKNYSSLSYGKICIVTDADEDGHHICSLILNMFHKLFPSLLLRNEPFFSIMMTPVAKITHNKKITSYYNDYEYQIALKELNDKKAKFEVKYYKGLGTSSNAEILSSFGEKVVNFINNDHTNAYMDKIFHKNCSSERKKWLLEYDPSEYITPQTIYPIDTYFDQELIKYSLEDCKRSIPNLYDGLKVSQRKILYSVFKKGLKYTGKSMKVAQLAGYCAENSNYHHGEQCLYETIIKMTHNFPGSNNIPYFEKDGQFGSRSYGGKDAANARYIFTKLAPLTRIIFPQDDDVLLNYTLDDGDTVQPDFYIPIIPTSLLNGCTAGIGTGWSCYLPCFSFTDLLNIIKEYLHHFNETGLILDSKFNIEPSYYGYKGNIEKIDDTKFRTTGILDTFVKNNKTFYEVKELPIGVWTDKFKEDLEVLQEQKKIKNLKNYSNTDEIHFVFENNSSLITKENLKLTNTLNMTNMVLFEENEKITKFDDIFSIFNIYFEKRLDLYQKRIDFKLKALRKELKILENKSRFILIIINKEIDIINMSNDDLNNYFSQNNFFNDSGFEYLLSMSIKDLTKTKFESLCHKIELIKKDIHTFKNTTSSQLWLNDLEYLESEYHKYY